MRILAQNIQNIEQNYQQNVLLLNVLTYGQRRLLFLSQRDLLKEDAQRGHCLHPTVVPPDYWARLSDSWTHLQQHSTIYEIDLAGLKDSNTICGTTDQYIYFASCGSQGKVK